MRVRLKERQSGERIWKGLGDILRHGRKGEGKHRALRIPTWEAEGFEDE